MNITLLKCSSTVFGKLTNCVGRNSETLRSICTSNVNNKAWSVAHLCLPPSLHHKLRRKVYFPDKYTVEPLRNDNLGGRDPVTGRVVVATIGGGIKHKYHWVDWLRSGPTSDEPPIVEKVVLIKSCGCRTANIALVGSDSKLRYILATTGMKPGDIIKTSSFIPRTPVDPNDGDAYPLGALQVGTLVHAIERTPGMGGVFVKVAGSCATVMRKINDRVILKMPSKAELSFSEKCMATVGRLSNEEHSSTPLGSAQALRLTGRRPRSGLWHRKDGRFGRKIKPPPPIRNVDAKKKETFTIMHMQIPSLNIKYPKNYFHVNLQYK